MLPSIGTDGTLTFTSAPNAFGAAAVTVQLVDDGGTANGGVDTSAAQTFNINVTGVNDPPVPQSAEYTIDEDTAFSGALQATDVDSDTLSFLPYLAPGQGTLDLHPDGTFTYTPNANYNGEDGFAFKVTDGQVTSAYATVVFTINPVNDAPVALGNNYEMSEDEALSITFRSIGVLGNDSDVDDPQASLTAELVSGTAHGTLSFAANGTFSYTPGADFAGIDTFTYRALDPHGAASDPALVTLSIANVNDPPVAQNASASTNEDTPLAGMLAALDVDSPDLTFSLAGAAAHGIVAVQTDGSYLYTPDANYFGQDSFSFKANDGELDSNLATVSLTVNPVNDAPVAQDASAATDEDTPLNGVLVALDVENDALTFSLGDDAVARARGGGRERRLQLHAGGELLRRRQLHVHRQRRAGRLERGHDFDHGESGERRAGGAGRLGRDQRGHPAERRAGGAGRGERRADLQPGRRRRPRARGGGRERRLQLHAGGELLRRRQLHVHRQRRAGRLERGHDFDHGEPGERRAGGAGRLGLDQRGHPAQRRAGGAGRGERCADLQPGRRRRSRARGGGRRTAATATRRMRTTSATTASRSRPTTARTTRTWPRFRSR